MQAERERKREEPTLSIEGDDSAFDEADETPLDTTKQSVWDVSGIASASQDAAEQLAFDPMMEREKDGAKERFPAEAPRARAPPRLRPYCDPATLAFLGVVPLPIAPPLNKQTRDH